jgi:hypothetical protein
MEVCAEVVVVRLNVQEVGRGCSGAVVHAEDLKEPQMF